MFAHPDDRITSYVYVCLGYDPIKNLTHTSVVSKNMVDLLSGKHGCLSIEGKSAISSDTVTKQLRLWRDNNDTNGNDVFYRFATYLSTQLKMRVQVFKRPDPVPIEITMAFGRVALVLDREEGIAKREKRLDDREKSLDNREKMLQQWEERLANGADKKRKFENPSTPCPSLGDLL